MFGRQPVFDPNRRIRRQRDKVQTRAVWETTKTGLAACRNVSPLWAAIVEEFGAGEGIRTLDPNLGKVVLYP